jgi:acylphosphatase
MLLHLIISGYVQGVGYRQFVKKTAKNLNLKGWVKNLDRGRVEALFCGPRDVLEEAIEACRKGSFIAQVRDIKIEWEEKEPDLNSFEIIL